MGLDITAYTKLQEVRPVKPDDEGDDGYDEGLTRVWNNRDFPGSFDGLKERTLYRAADSFGFRAGSYSGYNNWREWLARLVGYANTPYESSYGGERESHAAACWKGATGPFSELINFSDCEGTISATYAAKLAKDFAEWDDKAKADAPDTYYYTLYRNWRKAFEMAASGGAVSFH